MEIRTDDIIAIQQVLARYARGIDRLDRDLVESAYWADAYDDHGPFTGGRADFLDWVMREMPVRHTVTAHALGQSYFEFRDERAGVETHFVVRSHGHGEEAKRFRMLSGRYLDLFERRDGEWRILSRVTMYDSAGSTEAMSLAFPRPEGSRSKADPSYHIFENLGRVLPRADVSGG